MTVEAGLVADLGDDRIDLARHDRGARLQLRKNEFGQTGARARSKETEVVADLRELDSEALAGRRQSNVGAAVGRGSDQVFAVVEVDAGDFGEVLNGEGGVVRVSGNRRADSGGAEVDALQVFLSFLDDLDFVSDREAPAVEFLAEGHRTASCRWVRPILRTFLFFSA